MKKKLWIVKWWDDRADIERVCGFDTYEDALTYKAVRDNENARIYRRVKDRLVPV